MQQEAWGGDCQKSKQSPIALDLANHRQDRKFSFHYGKTESSERVLDIGHTLKVEFAPDTTSGLTLNGKFYKLAQLHFHTPAEHTVNGSQAAAEMHLVHVRLPTEATQPDYAVAIGIMIRVGEVKTSADKAIDSILEMLPVQKPLVDSGENQDTGLSLSSSKSVQFLSEFAPVPANSIIYKDQSGASLSLSGGTPDGEIINMLTPGQKFEVSVGDILASQTSFLTYNGSLTTAPCSEVVVHSVGTVPVTISKSTYDALMARYPGSNRDIQKVGAPEIRDFAQGQK